MATGIVVTRRPDARKFHKRLAEGGKLRIHRVIRGDTRCVVCATAIVDVNNRNIHLRENPTLKQRMLDPERTNGKPMVVQFWLQDDQGQLIGPCSAACGPKAVMNAWLKERRNEIRQQLLAAGVPPGEVEERLEQIAHQEWLNMLRVYRQCEREAKKLKIDITSMTFDEMVEAVKKEKERRRMEREVEYAQSLGLTVEPYRGGVKIDGTFCSTPQGVQQVVGAWREKQHAAQQSQAKQARSANRAQFQDYVDFIEWGLDTTALAKPNAGVTMYWDRRNLENGSLYIDRGSPFPKTLQSIEEIAVRARSWPEPWTGNLGQAKQPSVLVQTGAPVAGLPKCPKCGGELVRRTGVSQGRGKRYDFWGCKKYPNCKGSLEVAEYNRQWAAAGQGTAIPASTPTISASKALAHLQAQALGVKTLTPQVLGSAVEPEEEAGVDLAGLEEVREKLIGSEKKGKKKRSGYWS